MNSIRVIGIGLDGSAGLTPEARGWIDRATILIGSERHLGYFPSHPARKIVFNDFLKEIELINRYLDSSETIVILASGDPLFFGIGRLLLEKIPARNLVFYPHFSSVQLAFSAIKVPWQDARFISVHGRDLGELGTALDRGIEKIALLTDNINTPAAIARYYLSLNTVGDYDFYICENLGSEQECIFYFEHFKIQEIIDKKFASLNVVILMKRENIINSSELPLLGIDDRLFYSFPDRPNLITKKEIRIAILSELNLFQGQTIWDIGAGTGSVALEIARLATESTVYAVEKTAMGITLIEKNRRNFKVDNVIPVHGIAPDILEDLPNPDRIFIGGSGGNLTTILDLGCSRLKVGGRIILALATIENLNEAITWFKEKGWYYRLARIQIDRTASINHLTRWHPLNPVTLVIASLNATD